MVAGKKRHELQSIIDEAIARDYDSPLNCVSYAHNKDEGRTPLAYGVVMDKRQVVCDLVDLGAEINQRMGETTTALTLALTNEKRDCTEMVRILLSLDADPDPALIEAAGIDEEPAAGQINISVSGLRGGGGGFACVFFYDARVAASIAAHGVKALTPPPPPPPRYFCPQLYGRVCLLACLLPLLVKMRYWLKRARTIPVPTEMEKAVQRKLPPLDRMRQANFSIIGEEAALSSIIDLLNARFANPASVKSPLVLLLLGPPGHGKTYLTRNVAKALVGEENMLEVACGALRDDADLFGRAGHREVDGRLTRFLRTRQGRRSVVFLDEFEKIGNIVSSLGWEQATKMYMGFLEPWQEGKLTDNSGQGGHGGYAGAAAGGAVDPDRQGIIDCKQTVFILTSNWGQKEIIDFATANPDRVYGKINQDDQAWLKKELVDKVLQPLIMRKFRSINEEISALTRRITAIVPFLPLTTLEQRIVADTALRDHFAAYHDPAIHEGPEEERRLLGNLVVRCSDDYLKHVSDAYKPMEGASSMIKAADETEGKMLSDWMRKTLPLEEAERQLAISNEAPAKESQRPVIWLHHRLPSDDVVILRRKPARNGGAAEEDAALEAEGKADDGAGFLGMAAGGGGGGGGGGGAGGGGPAGGGVPEGKGGGDGDDHVEEDEGLDDLDDPF